MRVAHACSHACSEGEVFVYRTALGILKLYHDELLHADFEGVMRVLHGLAESMQVREHITQAHSHVCPTFCDPVVLCYYCLILTLINRISIPTPSFTR